MDDSNEIKHYHSLKHSPQNENENSQEHENQLTTSKAELIEKKVRDWAPILISLIAIIIATLTFYLLLGAESRAKEAEQRAIRSEKGAEKAEQRAIRSEKRAEEADQRAIRSEKRAEEADQRAIRSEKRAEEAEQRETRFVKHSIEKDETKMKSLAEEKLSEAWDLIGNRRGTSYIFKFDNDPGDLESARREIDQAIINDPHNAKAHRYKGVYYEAIGNFDKAVEEYKKAIEIEPSSARNWISLGNALTQKSQFWKAENAFQNASDLGGNKVLILINLGYLSKLQGFYRISEIYYYLAAELIISEEGKFLMELKKIKGLESSPELESILKTLLLMPGPPKSFRIID